MRIRDAVFFAIGVCKKCEAKYAREIGFSCDFDVVQVFSLNGFTILIHVAFMREGGCLRLKLVVNIFSLVFNSCLSIVTTHNAYLES